MLKKLVALAALVSTPAFAEPEQQRNFTTFVKSYHDLYLGSANAIAKNDLVGKRDADLDHALTGTHFFSNWEMAVVAVNVDQRNGKAWLTLVPANSSEPSFAMMNAPVFPNDVTHMGLNDKLREIASTLNKGDRVIVSGFFQSGFDKKHRFFDYDRETGKEEASMTLPKFAVSFILLDKVSPVTGALQPTPPAPAPSSSTLPPR